MIVVLRVSALAQLPTQLTLQPAIYPGSHRVSSYPAGTPFSNGISIPDSAAILCAGCTPGAVTAVPTNLELCTDPICASGQVLSQFRVLALWPDGNVKWVLVDGETQNNVTPCNSYDTTTFTVCPTGSADTAPFLVKSTCSGPCNFANGGTQNLAVQTDSTHITVSTGAATFIISYGADGFDIFHDVAISGTHLVLASNHGANDGLVLMGPPPNNASPNAATCAGGTSAAQPGSATGCTTPYLSNLDTASTCVIEDNGPLRATLKCMGDLKESGGFVYMHYTARETFYLNQPAAKLQVNLRNADKPATSAGMDFNSAYKQHASFVVQVTMNLTSGTRTAVFGNHTATPTSTTLSSSVGTDKAYLYQAYSNLYQFSDWAGRPDCSAGEADTCVVSPVQRTSGVYAQNGYQIIDKTAANIGPANTSGSVFNLYPEGWGDIADSGGAGVEIGVYQLAAYWPKSLEFTSGGSVARVGIWPDQSLYQGGGGRAYSQAWPKYSKHDAYFIFHNTALTFQSDNFMRMQHYMLARAQRGEYNASSDSTSGLLALLYNLIDPVAEDTYLKQLGLNSACEGQATVGNCLRDASSPLGSSPAVQIFRVLDVSQGGAGNQHEMYWSFMRNFLQRGALTATGSQPGRYINARHWYQYMEEGAVPRADFAGGWRGVCNSFSTCNSWENNWGYPSMLSINGGQRNFMDNVNSMDHAHFYGMTDWYFVSGDEAVKDAVLQSFKDTAMNQFAKFNNPGDNPSPGVGGIGASRAIGHRLMLWARLSIFLRDVRDSEADTTGTPTVLAGADNAVAFQVAPDVSMPNVPAGETEPSSCAGIAYYTSGCLSGLSANRGDHFPISTSNYWPPWGPDHTHIFRINDSFQVGILANGLHEYQLAANDLRRRGWTNTTLNGHLIGDQMVTNFIHGITLGELRDKFVDTGTQTTSGFVVYTYPEKLNTTDISNTCQVNGTCTSCRNGGDCSRICAQSSCKSLDAWGNFIGMGDVTNSTIMPDGTNWLDRIGVAIAKNDSGGLGTQFGGYHLQAAIEYVLNHTLSGTYTDPTIDPSVATLQPVTISPTTFVGPGTVNITWTAPATLSSVKGETYRLNYYACTTGSPGCPKTIMPWLGWHSNCLMASTTSDCTPNPCHFDAADASGCWELDPTANRNAFATTSIPDGASNTVALTSGSTSYSFIAAAGKTYSFYLSAFQGPGGAIIPPVFVPTTEIH